MPEPSGQLGAFAALERRQLPAEPRRDTLGPMANDSGRIPGPGSYRLGVGLLVLAACSALVFASSRGIGVAPDTVNYLRGAEGLLQRQGIFSLKLHWPPGYPALLAIGALFESDILAATRALHVVLFGANVSLFAFAMAPRSRSGRIVALVGVAFFASSTLSAHFMALSEAPFISLQLAAALLLVASLTPHRALLLWLSALLAALAVLIRFAGFPFAAVAALFVLVFGEGSIRSKLARSTLYGLVVCAPATAYIAGNKLVHGEALDRVLLTPSLSLEKLAPAPPALLAWFDPEHAWLAALLGSGCMALLACWHFRARSDPRDGARADLLALFGLAYSAAYLLFVLAYMGLLDRYLTINERTLFPAQVFFLVTLFVALIRLVELPAGRGVRVALGALLAVLLVTNVDATQRRVRFLAANGFGELDRSSRSLPILKKLRVAKLPQIYTNAPDLVYLHLGRSSKMVPRHHRPETGRENPAYRGQMQRVVEEVNRGDAVLVLFSRFLWRAYLPRPGELERDFALRPVYRAADGVIYARAAGEPGRP